MGPLKNYIDQNKGCSGVPTDNPNAFGGVLRNLMERKMETDDIQTVKTFDISCGEKQKGIMKKECDKYMKTQSFKDGTEGTYGHVICCDELKFCSGPFYTQIWFFAVCGGIALLLIGIIGVVVFLLCCRKKRGGGSRGGSTMKGSKNSKNSKGSKTSTKKSKK